MNRRSKNLREYLTLENPKVDSSKLTSGSTPSGTGVIGPDKTVKWTDFRLAAMEEKISEILDQEYAFEADKVPKIIARKLKPLKERGVRTDLHEKWNEPIICEAICATTDILREKDWLFSKGEVYFATNTGAGDIPREKPHPEAKKPKDWEPDWHCCQIFTQDSSLSEHVVPLLYGDTKPSGRFKSAWISSGITTERARAQKTLEQLTKYTVTQGLQYGFIITDMEFVALRLSKYLRYFPSSTVQPSSDSISQGLISELNQLPSAASNSREAARMRTASAYMPPKFEDRVRDVRAIKTASVNDSYPDDGKIDVYVEYAAIKWKEHGKKRLTVNLALWWLIILATENRLMPNRHLEEPSSNMNSQGDQNALRHVNSGNSRAELPPASDPGIAQTRITRARARAERALVAPDGTSVKDNHETNGRKRRRSETPDVDDDIQFSPHQAKTPRINKDSSISQHSSASQRIIADSFDESGSSDDNQDVPCLSFSKPNQGSHSFSGQNFGPDMVRTR